MTLIMSAFVTVCIALMTLGIWIGIGFLVSALCQVHRAAKAVEILAYRLEDSVLHLHNASHKFSDFTEKIRSGWMRALELLLGLAATVWQHRNDAHETAAGKTATPSE